MAAGSGAAARREQEAVASTQRPWRCTALADARRARGHHPPCLCQVQLCSHARQVWRQRHHSGRLPAGAVAARVQVRAQGGATASSCDCGPGSSARGMTCTPSPWGRCPLPTHPHTPPPGACSATSWCRRTTRPGWTSSWRNCAGRSSHPTFASRWAGGPGGPDRAAAAEAAVDRRRAGSQASAAAAARGAQIRARFPARAPACRWRSPYILWTSCGTRWWTTRQARWWR
jgi:hypothetical protein